MVQTEKYMYEKLRDAIKNKNANNRICQVLIMDTVKITTLNPPKKCVSAYGVNIVGSHGGEMQASLTPVVY